MAIWDELLKSEAQKEFERRSKASWAASGATPYEGVFTKNTMPESYTGQVGGITKQAKPRLWEGDIWQSTPIRQATAAFGNVFKPKPVEAQPAQQPAPTAQPQSTQQVSVVPDKWDRAAQFALRNPQDLGALKWLALPANLDSPEMSEFKAKVDAIWAAKGKKPPSYKGMTNSQLIDILKYKPAKQPTATDIIEGFEDSLSFLTKSSAVEEDYWSPEAIKERERKYVESRQRENWWHWSPQEQQQRQMEFEESARRQNQWYWSPDEVAQRQRQREESKAWQEAQEIEGWPEYFSVLDSLSLPYFADEYFRDTQRFNDLRRLWQAKGGGVPWAQWLQSFDFKSEWSKLPPSQRGELVAKFAPSARGESQL